MTDADTSRRGSLQLGADGLLAASVVMVSAESALALSGQHGSRALLPVQRPSLVA